MPAAADERKVFADVLSTFIRRIVELPSRNAPERRPTRPPGFVSQHTASMEVDSVQPRLPLAAFRRLLVPSPNCSGSLMSTTSGELIRRAVPESTVTLTIFRPGGRRFIAPLAFRFTDDRSFVPDNLFVHVPAWRRAASLEASCDSVARRHTSTVHDLSALSRAAFKAAGNWQLIHADEPGLVPCFAVHESEIGARAWLQRNAWRENSGYQRSLITISFQAFSMTSAASVPSCHPRVMWALISGAHCSARMFLLRLQPGCHRFVPALPSFLAMRSVIHAVQPSARPAPSPQLSASSIFTSAGRI